MYISFVEIQNFRKLKSVHVDFSKETTVFVGANNSGKTSAMTALHYFLIDHRQFILNDFTLSNLPKIDEVGKRWEQSSTPSLKEWEDILPSLDVWLHVEPDEIHHVSHIIPTLDWTGGLIGIRLRFEPKDIGILYKEYIVARKHAKEIIAAKKSVMDGFNLWPADMNEFLNRKLSSFFTVRSYALDPSKISLPEKGIARIQSLPEEIEPIEENPFKGLIRIDQIDAHRGFSNLNRFHDSNEDPSPSAKGRLSEQLRKYYEKHIDPSDMPDASDIEALEAIYQAQKQFDEKLQKGFKDKFDELEGLGYPGVTDPKLDIATKIKPIDGLNHNSALRYKIHDETDEFRHCLPEQSNGLGYQNLISMVFRLMSFRDEWMQVGKIGKKATIKPDEDSIIPPIHFLLVEEPEAHLHAQVQQVFIREAYQVLRNHKDLKSKNNLTTQLVVSTHSSHIAHECNFSNLRYFRRKPAERPKEVPISTVINLSEVFGEEEQKGDKNKIGTARFVARYIKTIHCDLFFADAAILIEGAAERILIPHFIKENFHDLSRGYITTLEINGSHAHTLRSLIEHLGLTTLIIGDIDSIDPANKNSSAQTARGKSLVTKNETLKTWIPKKSLINDLLDLKDEDKIKKYDSLFSIRVAYQQPIEIKFKEGKPEEVLARTFEDALVLENISIFQNFGTSGLAKKFSSSITESKNLQDLTLKMFEILQVTSGKAEFALDILFMEDLKNLKIPTYIKEGLAWLEEKIKNKHRDKDRISQPNTDLEEDSSELLS